MPTADQNTWPGKGRWETPSALRPIASGRWTVKSCCRWYSRFENPVARRSQKADGHGFAALVILHGDHGSLGDQCAINFFNSHMIVKLERKSGSKECLLRCGELDHASLHKSACTQARRQHLDLNAHRAGAGEKLRKLLHAAFTRNIFS